MIEDNTRQVTDQIRQFLTARNIDHYSPYPNRICVNGFRKFRIVIRFDFTLDFTSNPLVGDIQIVTGIDSAYRGYYLDEVIDISNEANSVVALLKALQAEFGHVKVYRYIENLDEEIFNCLDNDAREDMSNGAYHVLAYLDEGVKVSVGQLLTTNGNVYKVVSQHGHKLSLSLDGTS